MSRKRVDLTFPPGVSLKPVIYHVVRDYDVVPNIMRAQIQPGSEGRMLVELTGSNERLAEAIGFLKDQGLDVREAASDIRHDLDLCVHCGLCTSVCRHGALTLGADARLVIDREKCVYCEACVPVCPRRAIRLEF